METVITDQEARENLAENVNCILRSRGLSQRDLAEATNRHWTSINNVCCSRRLPGVTLVLAIGGALGYSVEELTGAPAAIVAQEKLRKRSHLVPA